MLFTNNKLVFIEINAFLIKVFYCEFHHGVGGLLVTADDLHKYVSLQCKA